jgi:hypothetical protein
MLIQCAILAKQKSNMDLSFVHISVKNLYHEFCKAKYHKKLISILEDDDNSLCHGCYRRQRRCSATSWMSDDNYNSNVSPNKLCTHATKNKNKLRGFSPQARTIPTERLPLVGEVSANFSG